LQLPLCWRSKHGPAASLSHIYVVVVDSTQKPMQLDQLR
jgi:hypothetical protein